MRLLVFGLTLSCGMVWAAIGNVKADDARSSQDVTARPSLILMPRTTKADKHAAAPRYRVSERRPLAILERLNLDKTVRNADRTLSEVLGTVRNGADTAWAWWVSSDGEEGSFIGPRQTGLPMPPRLPLHVPISAAPEEQLSFGVEDPYEPINRLVFDFNYKLQIHILDPLATVYFDYTSRAVRKSVRHFFTNLREPITIAASAFSGNFDGAGNATARFGINTTLGLAGLFDPASDMGFRHKPYDFEVMLCRYGLPSGPYVGLPVFGPATARDATARLLTIAAYFQVMGAAIYVPYRVSDVVVGYVDIRKKLESLNEFALDPYSVHRSLYIQRRNESCGKANPMQQFYKD